LSNAPTGAATVQGQSPCRYTGQGKNVTGPGQLRHAGSMQPGQLSPGLPLDTPQNQTRVLAGANVRIQHQRKVNELFFWGLPHQKNQRTSIFGQKTSIFENRFSFFPRVIKAVGNGSAIRTRGWDPQRERGMGDLCGASKPPHHATGRVAELWSVPAFACWEADRPAIKRGMGVLQLKAGLWQPGGVTAHGTS